MKCSITCPAVASACAVTIGPICPREVAVEVLGQENPTGIKSDFLRRMQNHLDSARSTINRFDVPHIEIDYSDFASKPQDTAELLGNHFGIDLIPEDLGYQKRYNNSTVRGHVAYFVEKVAAALPVSLRQILKNATPNFVMRALFPSKIRR